MPKPITNMVMDNNATSSETLKVSSTPAKSAVITEEANATTKQVKATTIVQYHLSDHVSNVLKEVGRLARTGF